MRSRCPTRSRRPSFSATCAAEAVLAGAVAKHLHESIRTAKRYPEGRPVRVMVKDKADLAASRSWWR